jgi:hypothetical protein
MLPAAPQVVPSAHSPVVASGVEPSSHVQAVEVEAAVVDELEDLFFS